jgi:hypothetical protein
MHFLLTLGSWEGVILLSGFFGIVVWKLFVGDISLAGLLEGDVRDANAADGFSSVASIGRSQSVTVSLFVALWYLVQVIHNPRQFPGLSDALVGTLAGSQVLYLGGKARAIFLGRLRNLLK